MNTPFMVFLYLISSFLISRTQPPIQSERPACPNSLIPKFNTPPPPSFLRRQEPRHTHLPLTPSTSIAHQRSPSPLRRSSAGRPSHNPSRGAGRGEVQSLPPRRGKVRVGVKLARHDKLRKTLRRQEPRHAHTSPTPSTPACACVPTCYESPPLRSNPRRLRSR